MEFCPPKPSSSPRGLFWSCSQRMPQSIGELVQVAPGLQGNDDLPDAVLVVVLHGADGVVEAAAGLGAAPAVLVPVAAQVDVAGLGRLVDEAHGVSRSRRPGGASAGGCAGCGSSCSRASRPAAGPPASARRNHRRRPRSRRQVDDRAHRPFLLELQLRAQRDDPGLGQVILGVQRRGVRIVEQVVLAVPPAAESGGRRSRSSSPRDPRRRPRPGRSLRIGV